MYVLYSGVNIRIIQYYRSDTYKTGKIYNILIYGKYIFYLLVLDIVTVRQTCLI